MENDKEPSETATRSYRMQARAQSAAETGERILDAAVQVFYEKPMDHIALDEVARRAGVSVQTVIRRYGGKEGLFTAAAEREYKRIASHRDQPEAGDVAEALRILLDHYEEVGNGVLRMLAEEHRTIAVRELVDQGRKYHQMWCERVFSPVLAVLQGEERERRLAQLFAITDVYIWQLLRRHRGMSRSQTELALRELLQPLIGGT
ncbi:TetR/AcrR family transcriptional regulator [Cohnella terricola]|uniref:TetR/AcrR family transcriptional regulator n=1 Tax=Cohnella terricola TaxID=1289167 RepID=A0A559JIS8_9BACL|nr:TetR/AcrR family transcriptional regulator [Cohnella terricola]TVX99780.1 TetR/AcrR family transcriptional regulator [Cohnella terricola]